MSGQAAKRRVAGAQPCGDLPGAVGGAVVDEDDLVVRVAQCEERPQGRLHGALLVVGRDDDGEGGGWGVVGVRWGGPVQPGDLVVAEYGGGREGEPGGEGEGREGEWEGHVVWQDSGWYFQGSTCGG